MMQFIDTHSHIFEKEFDQDRNSVVERCLECGVNDIILPSIDTTTHEAMYSCCERWSFCHAAFGLHPTSVNENYKKEIEVVESLIKNKSCVAVGEIGLDFYWSKEFYKEQIEALHLQIDIALRYGKPVLIHTRDAFTEMEKELSRYQGTGLKVLLHGYSSDIEQYYRLENMNLEFYYGIGGVVTFKNSSLKDVVRGMTLDKMVLETDSPYLTPVPHRGKRNESSYIPIIAQQIADIKEITIEEVAAVTTKNAKLLFNID
ncbi:MAG: TatD family hydrolase [Rikenellaceae bacterium]